MRIAYGVHGYGRGHATRALTVLPELTSRHEVLVLAGGDAYDMLAERYDVVRIPHLRYYYRRAGRRSAVLTIWRNLRLLADLKFGTGGVRQVADTLAEFRPQVVLSDSDAWTLRAARKQGLPRLSFDHYGIMVYCCPPLGPWGRLKCRIEAVAYKALMGWPDRVIVSAFFEAPPKREGVTVVGPMLRPLVREMRPTRGEHLLVYFSSGRLHFTPRVEEALQGIDWPVIVYNKEREGREGNLDFRLLDTVRFVEDLAASRAVFATAGNQLIGETLHFGKPLLVLPEDSLEQRVNAAVVEEMGVGMQTSDDSFSPTVLDRFLARADELAHNVPAHARDGVPEALAAIERDLVALAGVTPSGP